jgi:ribosomal protein S18 acetylase RimI-like enzyme
MSEHHTPEIRPMEIDDLAAVYHLGEKLFTSDRYPSLYRTWDEWEVTGLFNTDSDDCLVAEIDGVAVGFVLATILKKGSWTYGYIIWLGVDEAHQRRRIADALVDEIIEILVDDGARMVICDTDPANRKAMNFFKRKGFGNERQHVFLSLNVARHPVYGKLVQRLRRKKDHE